MKRTALIIVATVMLLSLTACGKRVYTEESKKTVDEGTPTVTVMSSCGWGTARGKYTVTATGYGAVCSGRGYSEKESAISNPLEIASNGLEIVVTLADDDVTTVEMYAGDSMLISCKSGSFHGYLYVVIT